MITIEQLNAIPGRPSFLAEWIAFNNMPCCYHKDGPLLGERAISYYDRLYCFPLNHSTARDLLSFAVYVRRVEIEIERMEHDDMFFAGNRVCDRHEAIELALDGVDKDNNADVVEVAIVQTSRVYPGDCIGLDTLGDHIVDQCEQDEGGSTPQIRWKDGASEALSVFLDTYADLDPWWNWGNGEDEESITVRFIRHCGVVVDWEEVE